MKWRVIIFKKSYLLQNPMQCCAVWGRKPLRRPQVGGPVSPDGRRACIIPVSLKCPWSKKMVDKIAALRDFRIHTCFSSLADDKKAQTSGESWCGGLGSCLVPQDSGTLSLALSLYSGPPWDALLPLSLSWVIQPQCRFLSRARRHKMCMC